MSNLLGLANFTVDEIKEVTLNLVEQMGSTTTLDVKRALRNLPYGRWATQDTVSWALDQYNEEWGLDWSWNGHFRTYYDANKLNKQKVAAMDADLRRLGQTDRTPVKPYRHAEKWYCWYEDEHPARVGIYEDMGRNQARALYEKEFNVPYSRVYASLNPPNRYHVVVARGKNLGQYQIWATIASGTLT